MTKIMIWVILDRGSDICHDIVIFALNMVSLKNFDTIRNVMIRYQCKCHEKLKLAEDKWTVSGFK